MSIPFLSISRLISLPPRLNSISGRHTRRSVCIIASSRACRVPVTVVVKSGSPCEPSLSPPLLDTVNRTREVRFSVTRSDTLSRYTSEWNANLGWHSALRHFQCLSLLTEITVLLAELPLVNFLLSTCLHSISGNACALCSNLEL